MKLLNLFSENDVRHILDALAKTEWRDGGETASGSAKNRKKNEQITENDPVVSKNFEQIKVFITRHAALRVIAFPRKVINVRAARYSEGDSYGWHVDQATMSGHRSDLSFTIFLSDKDAYDGGELEADYGTHKVTVKGGKGQMVVYPTGLLHQVRPVTRGERLVIVGWIESLVPNNDDRENLTALYAETSALKKKLNEPEAFDTLNRAVEHMVRMASR